MIPELDTNRSIGGRPPSGHTPIESRRGAHRGRRDARGLTIKECRPPWSDRMGPEWTRMPIARLSYVKERNEWRLYWADRNGRFQRCWKHKPSHHVGVLLDEIDSGPTCIFWG